MSVPAEPVAVSCNNCQTPLPDARPDEPLERRKPCPNCGSLSRSIHVEARDKVEIHSDLHVVHRRPGFKSGGKSRPIMELWVGDSLSVKDGVWRVREQAVDRAEGRYRKVVKDQDGTVVYGPVDEPLSEHTERGSAKPGMRKPDGA